MTSSSPKSRLPSILCLAYIAAIQTERGILAARGIELPGQTVLFDYLIFACLMGYWFEVDSRQTRVLRLWDMGWFLTIGWPVVIPYYLARTRGSSGPSSFHRAWWPFTLQLG